SVVDGGHRGGMALALDRPCEPFSKGRGFITPKRVAEIETIAARHGLHLAPFSSADGPLERQFEYQTQSSRGWVARHVRPPPERSSRSVARLGRAGYDESTANPA